ncbi:MAG: DNA primase small subunit PriS, partial [Halobacteria archaeon]|nr:DNA primase small subunit PriS [Halobacteria archaeon]
MDERTQAYVKGRFGDYYRGEKITPPRAHDEREWAYIPFTPSPETRMIRHRSLLDLGSLDAWLADAKPQHVYYSSARYNRPQAQSMNDKGWKGADLIFDLDADHLDDVEPEDSYAEMLSKCKDELIHLLEFMEDDFGFEDTQVVFSGGRGYHIHVFDDRVQYLRSEARREIVDYVRGIGFAPKLAFSGEKTAGSYGRKSPTEVRKLNEGAWSKRIRDYVLGFADEIAE